MNQVDFHNKLGQFNGYIEQYMDHARREQIRFADEIAKASKAGDKVKVNQLIENRQHSKEPMLKQWGK